MPTTYGGDCDGAGRGRGGHGAQTHAVPGARGSHVLCGVHSACGLCIFLHDLNSVAGMAEL